MDTKIENRQDGAQIGGDERDCPLLTGSEWVDDAKCPECGCRVLQFEGEVYCSFTRCDWGLGSNIKLDDFLFQNNEASRD